MDIKEAIEELQTYKLNNSNFDEEIVEAIETVLAELEKQSKIINLMAERLTTDIHSKEWVIDYYEREVEK